MITIKQDTASVLLQQLMDTVLGDSLAASGNAIKLSIYDGVRPAKPEDAITTNTLLAEIVANPSNGAANEHWIPIPSASGKVAQLVINGQFLTIADGTATWFRMYSEEGIAIFDGNVSDNLGSGELKLSTTNIVMGIYMKATSITITIPYEH